MNNVVSSGEVQLQVFKKKLCVFRVFQDSERKTSEHSPNIHGCNSVFFSEKVELSLSMQRAKSRKAPKLNCMYGNKPFPSTNSCH